MWLLLQFWPYEEEDTRFAFVDRDCEPELKKVPSAFVLKKEDADDRKSDVGVLWFLSSILNFCVLSTVSYFRPPMKARRTTDARVRWCSISSARRFQCAIRRTRTDAPSTN